MAEGREEKERTLRQTIEAAANSVLRSVPSTDRSPTEREATEKHLSIQGILARAREYNFLVAVFVSVWVPISAMGALALRAYQSFGIGNTALLAVAVALLGIWGVPRIFERVRPRKPTLKEVVGSLIAGLLVLFVWTANIIPSLFQKTESAVPPVPSPAEITSATRATEKKSLTPSEEQFRLDLRKLVLSPLDDLREKYSNVFLPLLRSQHNADMEFFGIELIQKGLYRDFEAASAIAKHDLNEIDPDGLQYAIVRMLGTYTQSQDYIRKLARSQNISADKIPSVNAWIDSDAQCLRALRDLKASPLAKILQTRAPDDWMASSRGREWQ